MEGGRRTVVSTGAWRAVVPSLCTGQPTWPPVSGKQFPLAKKIFRSPWWMKYSQFLGKHQVCTPSPLPIASMDRQGLSCLSRYKGILWDEPAPVWINYGPPPQDSTRPWWRPLLASIFQSQKGTFFPLFQKEILFTFFLLGVWIKTVTSIHHIITVLTAN